MHCACGRQPTIYGVHLSFQSICLIWSAPDNIRYQNGEVELIETGNRCIELSVPGFGARCPPVTAVRVVTLNRVYWLVAAMDALG